MHVINAHQQLLSGTLWGITVYFNPVQYKNKLDHLRAFAKATRKQGLQLLIIELAIGSHPYVIDEELADRVVRLRTPDVLWHKERLLNISLRHLPGDCDKIVWLDGDLLFARDDWPKETASLLEHAAIVQPFETAHWLNKGITSAALALPNISGEKIQKLEVQEDRSLEGAACLFYRNHRPCTLEGHTGFAWAGRRAVFDRYGFYDRLILGGGDAILSFAMLGLQDCADFEKHISSMLPRSQADDIYKWIRPISEEIGRSIGYVPGDVYHLWHGEFEDRKYVSRFAILVEEGFDPQADLTTDENGVWRWATAKPALRRRVREYFEGRREDLDIMI